MGLLRNRNDDQPQGQTFQMREEMLTIGDDYWIENEEGQKVYKVNGKAVRLRDTFILEDNTGGELAKIQEKKLSVRDKMKIEWGGTDAVVHKALVGIRDRFVIDPDNGEKLHAHGNFVDHEYEIERDGTTIATISKKWFRLRDTYGVEIAADENQPFILAVTVCIDEMARG